MNGQNTDTHGRTRTDTGRGSSVINRAQVRRRLLECAAATRAQRFTRVSEATLDDAEAALESWIRARVHGTPSVGKTL